MIDANGILMVEPLGSSSTSPVIDEITRKMTAAWRKRRDSSHCYRGFHMCCCGAISDNKEHWVGEGDGKLTNSLSIHYLAFHRIDIPDDELAKVRQLNFGEEEPTECELHPPRLQL